MPVRSGSASSLSRQSSRESFPRGGLENILGWSGVSSRGILDSGRLTHSGSASVPGSVNAPVSGPSAPSVSLTGVGSVSVPEGVEAAGNSMEREPQSSAVRVVVRFRPPLPLDNQHAEDAPPAWVVDPGANCVESPDLQHRFQFDRALTRDADQANVYDDVGRPVVDDVLQGYHGTILAYGQTGSGKTYCMFGPPGQHGPDFQGLVPRCAQQVFDHVGSVVGADLANESKFVIECNFFEVYCEQLRDLLKPGNAKLQVKELPPKGCFIEGLTHKPVNSVNEVLQVLRSGLKHRAAANTRLNHHSSRSHAIFTLRVQQQTTEGTTRNGKLTLVDLAGSEKVHKSCSEGEMLEEAKKINSSLSALGHVIDALADRRPHVPYRDSRLTRILEDSLGGNCRTTLLVACSPSGVHFSETLSSLRFAARAKRVCNFARINVTYACDRQLLSRIAHLRRELARAHHELERRFSNDPEGSVSPTLQSTSPRRSQALSRSLSSGTKDTIEQDLLTSDGGSLDRSDCSRRLISSISGSSITSAPNFLSCRGSVIVGRGSSCPSVDQAGTASPRCPVSGASREDTAHTESGKRSLTSNLDKQNVGRLSSVPASSSGGSTIACSVVSSTAQSGHSASVTPLPARRDASGELSGGTFNWLVEASSRSDARQMASASPPVPNLEGGMSLEESSGGMRRLEMRLELERHRCASLSLELEQRTQESKHLAKQLQNAEARSQTVVVTPAPILSCSGPSLPVLSAVAEPAVAGVVTHSPTQVRVHRVARTSSGRSQRHPIGATTSRTPTTSPMRVTVCTMPKSARGPAGSVPTPRTSKSPISARKSSPRRETSLPTRAASPRRETSLPTRAASPRRETSLQTRAIVSTSAGPKPVERRSTSPGSVPSATPRSARRQSTVTPSKPAVMRTPRSTVTSREVAVMRTPRESVTSRAVIRSPRESATPRTLPLQTLSAQPSESVISESANVQQWSVKPPESANVQQWLV